MSNGISAAHERAAEPADGPPRSAESGVGTRPAHGVGLLPNLAAGLVAGVISVFSALSYAALLFSGDLSNHLSRGIGLTLVAALTIRVGVAATTSFPTTIAGLDASAVAILAVLAAGVASALPATAAGATMFAAVACALALTTVLCGIALLALGWLRAGDLIRFFPYPVIGGFMAGAGWLLLNGSLVVITGVDVQRAGFAALGEPGVLIKLFPGALFAVTTLVAARHFKHYLVLPCCLISGIVLFYLGMLAAGGNTADALAGGWLLGPFPEGSIWQPLRWSEITAVPWVTVLEQMKGAAAVLVIAAISIPLTGSALELVSGDDIDPNRELRAAGFANVLSGLMGGIVGYHSATSSTMVWRMGARGRLAPLFTAALLGAALAAGPSLLSLLPRPVLGGLLLFLGLNFLSDWLLPARSRLSRLDYLVVVLILLVIAGAGFLEGVGVGLVIAVILFAVQYSRVDVTRHIRSGDSARSNMARAPEAERLLSESGDSILVLHLQGFLFFGTANGLLTQVRERMAGEPPLRFVVLDFRLVSGLDSSAAINFQRMRQVAAKQGVRMVFAAMPPALHRQLQQAGCLELPVSVVMQDADRGLEWCEHQILGEHPPEVLNTSLEQQLGSFLSPAHVQVFLSFLAPRDFGQGDCVMRQGEKSDSLYFLERGQVSVLLELPNGGRKRLRTFSGGIILGEMGVYSNAPRSASVVADRPSRLHALSSEALRRMEQEHPEVAAAFHKSVVNLLAERLRHCEAELRDLLR